MSKPEKPKTSNAPGAGGQQQQQQKKEKKPKPKKEPHQNLEGKAGVEKGPPGPGPDQKPKQQQPAKQKQQQQPSNKKQQQNQPKKAAQQPSKKPAAQPKPEVEKKEDIFQAVLLADNFGSSIFGPDSPLLQEGLVRLTNRRLVDYSLESLTSSGVQEIYLYCSTQTDELRNYIQNSKWSTLPHCAIRVIVGEDALSLGDALRDLDAKGFLRSEFILMNAGVISNLPLRDLLELHRENIKKDKGTVLTLINRKLLPGHRSRGKTNNPVIVVDSSSGKILAYESKPSGKKLHIPIDKIGTEMDIFMDSIDTGITVCSSSVPPLFTDNFDFTTIQDAIKEIMINEDILGNSIYLHRLDAGYANRVVDFETFQGISCDILQRWTFPSVPDMRFGAESDQNMYSMQANFVYKSANVKIRGVQAKSVLIGANSEIGKGSLVHYTSIGNNCMIGENVQIFNCQIGDSVNIPAGSQLSRCILTTGTVLKEKEELESILFANGARFEISLPAGEEETSDEDESDSEKSDNMSISSGPDVDGHQIDQDLQSFNTEVTESLLRGFKASVATENLVLEINSSKFAYNMTFKEVTSGICKAVLSIAPRVYPDFIEKTPKVQWERTKEAIVKLKSVIANYVRTAEHQMDLLEAIEEYANDNPQFRPLLMQSMHLLYDEEILTEDAILKWHKHSSLYEAGAELRRLVTKLIDWLEASDSESEDEEE